jgi:predicted  nucleic acid-binding Zn-ribbon protein
MSRQLHSLEQQLNTLQEELTAKDNLYQHSQKENQALKEACSALEQELLDSKRHFDIEAQLLRDQYQHR